MPKLKNLKQLAWLTLAASALMAAAASAATEDEIARSLERAVPGLEVLSVTRTEAPGLYEVASSNGQTIYTTGDGQYLITGDLLKVTDSGITNISEQTRARQRQAALQELGSEGLIRFPARGAEKVVINVFTDIDCPYCRKLHDEVPQLNGYGITVNYYAFPRSGPGTPSFRKYESVWCAKDPQAAMTAAKSGQSVPAASCDNPVLEQYELGRRIGVTGTPAIVLEDGQMIRGYVPAETLARGLGVL